MAGLDTARAAAFQALGQRLRSEREARGWTQEQLAHRAGISRVHVQQLESGVSDRKRRTPANPKLTTLVALAGQLGLRFVVDVASAAGLVIEIDDQPRPARP